MRDLLAPHGVQIVGIGGKRQRLLILICLFFGIDLFAGADFMGRKKLLRFAAGRSTRAVVTPVNCLHDAFIVTYFAYLREGAGQQSCGQTSWLAPSTPNARGVTCPMRSNTSSRIIATNRGSQPAVAAR